MKTKSSLFFIAFLFAVALILRVVRTDAPETALQNSAAPEGRQATADVSLPSADQEKHSQTQGITESSTVRPEEVPSETLCRNVPVLSTVQGFEISSCMGGQLSMELASEELDAGWASQIEARIRRQIEDYEQLRFSRVAVECRKTACGIFMVLAEDLRDQFVPREHTRIMVESMAESLGFKKSATVSGNSADGVEFRFGLLQNAEGREYLWPDSTESKTVEALSGVSGYRIPISSVAPGINFPAPAELLAAEPVDETWSAQMQGQIYGQLASMSSSVSQLHVECRSTRCGVVVDYGRNASNLERQAVFNELPDLIRQLGFSYCDSGVASHLTESFTAMYFEYRDDGACALDVGRARAP